MTRRLMSLAAAMVLAVSACTTLTSAPPSTLPPVTAIPAAAATRNPVHLGPAAQPSPSAYPALPHGTRPLPTMRPLQQYDATPLTLTVRDAPGQPAEAVAWTVQPFRPDPDYAARVAAAFGVPGPGTVGAAPGGSAPWRLWLGAQALAVNEVTGDVLFLDPLADDGPRPPGPAQRDPADVFARMLAPLGTTIDLTPSLGRVPALRGGDTLSFAESLMDGSWIGFGREDRDAAVIFAAPQNPRAPRDTGPTIYDSDELGIFTGRGRPIEIVHRPFGTLAGGEIYPVTPYGEAAAELRADPRRYLRLLSAPPGEAVTLAVTADGAWHGSAWAGGARWDLTRARRTLVPVWAFFAEGTSASGRPASALFVVDAVVPELRAPPASAALALDADMLLRTQLTVSVGGHQPWRMSATEVAHDELRSFGIAPSVRPTVTMPDADTALVSASDGNRSVGFTLRRAFPGLPASIWYLSEAWK